jgi:hypothetical protein
MAEFERIIEPKALTALRRLAEKSGENWWKDLLKLWRPSGLPSEDHGLRLAVRRNYLNFYFRGQSVARIWFVAGEPCVSTHIKYVFKSAEGQRYSKMRDGKGFQHPVTSEFQPYKGHATLLEFIERADEHKGVEKTCVDELVAANPSIIDLEMGLPKIAQRMDCIALEREQGVISVVFWEAKMIDDPRLRSKSKAKVITQLKGYRDFLEADARELKSVERAYQETCKLLVKFHGMAAQFPDRPALDPLVIAVANEATVLKVDCTPRLVIFGGKYEKKSKWDDYRKLLEAERIPCLVFSDERYLLRRPDAAD